MAACQWKHRGGCCLRYIQPFKQTECWEIGKAFLDHNDRRTGREAESDV